MTTPPKYGILIQPHGDDAGLNKLLVTITLESPQRTELQSLCYFEASPDDPPHRYSESNTSATDGNGRLEVTFSTAQDGSIDVKARRHTAGDVVLTLEVTPRVVDEWTSPVPETELYHGQGGLIGVAGWFLPRIPYREMSTFNVAWDLSLAPLNTKASWSFGEGPEVTTQTGTNDLLLSSVFMVGPIVSYQTTAPSASDSCSMQLKGDEVSTPLIHSFGELPAIFQPLLESTAPIFFCARSIFESPESTMKVYIRKLPRGFSGHNYASCFMINYSDKDKPRHKAELLRYMSHEMTHNWVHLGNESDGYQNMWFIEGIADFYALHLPVMAGVEGVEYFCQMLDEFLTIYYTSSYLRTPLREVPNDSNGILVSYRRGFIYFLILDAQLRIAAKSRPEPTHHLMVLHPIIMTICRTRWAGNTTDSDFWRETLYPLLEKQTVDIGLRDMMDGKVLKPYPELTIPIAGKTIKFKPCEQEMIELGFSDKSFQTRIIEGLVPVSKAEMAGLRNGDMLLYHTAVSICRLDLEHPFSFVARRGDMKIQGEYFPRSGKTVPSYRTEIFD